MTNQTLNHIYNQIDKARQKAFNSARSQVAFMMRDVKVNDDTVAMLARDAYNHGIINLILKAKAGEVTVESPKEANALLIAYARTSSKSMVRDFVRERKYDTQAIYDRADALLDNCVELRDICGNRFTDPLQALLEKEKRKTANAATKKLSERDLQVLDTWLDLASSSPADAKVLTAAKLGLTKEVVYQSIHRSKIKLAKALR